MSDSAFDEILAKWDDDGKEEDGGDEDVEDGDEYENVEWEEQDAAALDPESEAVTVEVSAE